MPGYDPLPTQPAKPGILETVRAYVADEEPRVPPPETVTVRVAPTLRIDRRTGQPMEHPAEKAAREYNEAAVISRPAEAELRRRVAELEAANAKLLDCWAADVKEMERSLTEKDAELAAKDRFVAGLCERLKAAAEVIGRNAEREAEKPRD